MSLIRGVNAILWADNFTIKAQVWGDIGTKITIGFTFAVPASALCLMRHLESVSSRRSVHYGARVKQRRTILELIMCFGVPIIFMALHYIVQGHRYDLVEDFGCLPTVYFSYAGIFLIFLPSLLLSAASFVYAAFVLHHFLRHRIEFASHLRNSQSSMNPRRYFRLMALAIFEMCWDVGLNIYNFILNVQTGIRPWISWDNVHSNFSRIQVFPSILFALDPSSETQLLFQWWITPVSCFIFFIFLGLTEEAISDYRKTFNWFRRVILRQKIQAPTLGSVVLPTHRPRLTNVVLHANASADTLNVTESKSPSLVSLQPPLPVTIASSRQSIHLAFPPIGHDSVPGPDHPSPDIPRSPATPSSVASYAPSSTLSRPFIDSGRGFVVLHPQLDVEVDGQGRPSTAFEPLNENTVSQESRQSMHSPNSRSSSTIALDI